MKVINDRIANLITELRMNPNSFADAIGVKGPVVYNIIKGRRTKPSYDLLLKIISAYSKINTTWLLKGEGNIWIEEVEDVKDIPPILDVEVRITALLEDLAVTHVGDPLLHELSDLIKLLMEENNYHKSKILRLYEKNEKLMDVLREKLGLDI